jgi:dnd system-associated protein 4
MNERDTITDVAKKVLQILGRPASIDELYVEIVSRKLYEFNTPTPEHVLRTTIRRHTRGVERVDASDVILFDMTGDEMYTLAGNANGPSKKPATPGTKRIQRANDKEEIIKSLMSEQVGVFKEIWRLLLFAAQVGFKSVEREPLKSVDTGKGIDQTTFGNCPSWPGVLYLMALADSGSSDSLSGVPEAEEQRVATFQEYANGGLRVLKDFFADRPIDLDGLLAFIEGQRGASAGRPDLELTI